MGHDFSHIPDNSSVLCGLLRNHDTSGSGKTKERSQYDTFLNLVLCLQDVAQLALPRSCCRRAVALNNVGILTTNEQDKNIGNNLKEMTKGCADVVIDAVGMDGKMSDLEFLASGLKLQGSTMSAFIIASQAVRKGGTIQVTGGIRRRQ